MKFSFNAVNQKGERYKGVRDSTNKFTLYDELKSEGDNLISAVSIDAKQPWYLSAISFFSKVPEIQKIIFAKNLGAMIEAGLPISKSLDVINRQLKNKYFKGAVSSIEEEMRGGKTLSESLSMYGNIFSNLFTSMVKAGEESGKLSDSLKIIGTQMEQSYNLKRKIKGAMIYPAIILSLTVIIGVLMMIFVIPSITATFTDLNVELPLATKILIYTSNLFKNDIFIILLAAAVLFAASYFFAKSKIGKNFFDFLFLKTPIVGELIKETNAARLSRTLSSLLSSGVPYAESIKITENIIENHYFKNLLKESRAKVEKGETVSSVFLSNEKLTPPFIGEMIAVGEETGRLPSMLLEVAEYYELSVEQKTKDMSTIIEPFLMIIIGVAVGFFAFSIIKPIYSLTSAIN